LVQRKKSKRTYLTARDEVAVILAKGAVSLLLIIAGGAFGRAFYLAIVTHKDMPISQAATQLITSLGSALIGGVIAFTTAGLNDRAKDDKAAKPKAVKATPPKRSS
jgi:hypothetical protein